MLHATIPTVPLQRARGHALVALEARAGRTRLVRLRQEGSAKAFLPSVHAAEPEVVFLNTAGGLTGGDRLAFDLSVASGAAAVATTQAAERAYASAGGTARLSVRLTVGRRGRLDWLPQETILFDGAALARRTEIELGREAQCLLVETIVLGRAAMGERVERLDFRDLRVVRREGRPELVEALALDGRVLAAGGRRTLLGGARAFATLALVAPGAEDAAGAVRAVAPEAVEIAVSGWNGKCVVRLLGPDAWPVRRGVAAILAVLRKGRGLPRVWQI